MESDSDDDDDDGDAHGAASNYKKPTSNESKSQLDHTIQMLKRQLGFDDVAKSEQILKTVDFQGLIDHWNKHGFKKIITMVGAGISTCKLKQTSSFSIFYFLYVR